MTAYPVLKRTERLRTAIFQIVTDEIAMPDGGTAVRDYMVHPGAVGVVALDEHGRVVLVYQYRHAVGRHLWELPAGLIDVEGESRIETAMRELAEETDLRAGRWDLLADVHPSPGCSNELIRLFLARDLSEVPPEQRHKREYEEADLKVQRFALDEAVTMALTGEITNSACLVGVLATAEARQRDWATLRPVDTPLPSAQPE
jgi:8-oxo-dGDP phosphatase